MWCVRVSERSNVAGSERNRDRKINTVEVGQGIRAKNNNRERDIQKREIERMQTTVMVVACLEPLWMCPSYTTTLTD